MSLLLICEPHSNSLLRNDGKSRLDAAAGHSEALTVSHALSTNASVSRSAVMFSHPELTISSAESKVRQSIMSVKAS